MRLARALAVLIAACLPACYGAGWKLILTDGKTIECDGPPIVVDGTYLFRTASGEDGSLSGGRIDLDKTNRANGVDPHPRWSEIRPSGQAPQRRGSAAWVSGAGIVTLGDADFESRALRSEGPVLVEFWATWCGPCRAIAPTVDAIASEYSGRLTVGTVDVDQNRATVQRYQINGTPTLLLFKDGRVVGRYLGVADRSEIRQMLRAVL